LFNPFLFPAFALSAFFRRKDFLPDILKLPPTILAFLFATCSPPPSLPFFAVNKSVGFIVGIPNFIGDFSSPVFSRRWLFR
jgi:hypothetical protein